MTVWPVIWKKRNYSPNPQGKNSIKLRTYNNLRPISKILESFLSEYKLAETGAYWKKSQHGGSSADHVLVKTWDKILASLDKSINAKAVTLTTLDFSKSFDKCTHPKGIQMSTCKPMALEYAYVNLFWKIDQW